MRARARRPATPTPSPAGTSTTNDPNLMGTQPIVFAYYRSSAGVWTYWAQSVTPRRRHGLDEGAAGRPPPCPAGATERSPSAWGSTPLGSVTIDDFSLLDNTPPPDTTAPTSSITCNGGTDAGDCQSGYYSGTVQVALDATDDLIGTGVSSIRYTADGSDPSADQRHHLQRPVRRRVDDDRQVPRLRQGRQRRSRQLTADPGRHHRIRRRRSSATATPAGPASTARACR